MKKWLSILREKESESIHTICMHYPSNLFTALPAAEPSSKLPWILDSTSVGTLAFLLVWAKVSRRQVWPVLMNPALTITLHLGRLTAELSVGNAQSGALRLKTTVPLQQQHLQRFGRVLMEGTGGTEIKMRLFKITSLRPHASNAHFYRPNCTILFYQQLNYYYCNIMCKV